MKGHFIVGLGMALTTALALESCRGERVPHMPPAPGAGPLAHAQSPAPAGASNGEKMLLRETAESFRQIARQVAPAVVSVKSSRAPSPGAGGQAGLPPGLREFFEHFGLPYPSPEAGPQVGLGSGFFIDDKGHLVTNYHVIEGADQVVVTFDESATDRKAKVVGVDPRTDLAVLKVDGFKPKALARWADFESVEVGDWAVAIGSPFALGSSVTVGIVSAKERQGEVLAGTAFSGDLLQTDAAINPGNSGGPLCDINGRVMGVNTAIYTRSGGYMGIGFAIPSRLASEITAKLITDGKIVRGWLGVTIQPVDPALAKELKVDGGALVHAVMPESPAARAGVRAGDVIVEVTGTPIDSPRTLQKLIAGFKPGQSVPMKVVAYDTRKSRNVDVKIGTLPESGRALGE